MQDNEGTPRDFIEYSEPCSEGRRWELLGLMDLAVIENENQHRDFISRIKNCQYEAEAYEIKKEIYGYIDNSTDMRMKAIGKRVDNSVNRKNT